jgi:hypothetical protein
MLFSMESLMREPMKLGVRAYDMENQPIDFSPAFDINA